MHYFALTTRGLEDISVKEIQNKISDAKIKLSSYRKVVFESHNAEISQITALKSIEDAFILIGELEGVGHTKPDLVSLVNSIARLDFSKAKSEILNLRNISNFSISASSVGKRNYSMPDLKLALREKLERILNLKFEDEKHEDFDLRIFLEHDKCFIAVRINQKPLYRRTYKSETTEASLKSNIAYAMCFLAEVSEGETILDPMCGSGTILLESTFLNSKRIIGYDISHEAIEVTKINFENLNSNIDFEIKLGDATKLDIEDKSIDKIITNLPFGKQIAIEKNITEFYLELLKEFKRLIKNNGKIVILTSKINELKDAIDQSKSLKIESEIEISLHGEIARIFVVNSI